MPSSYSVQSLLDNDCLIAVVASDGPDAEDMVGLVEAFGDRIPPVQADFRIGEHCLRLLPALSATGQVHAANFS